MIKLKKKYTFKTKKRHLKKIVGNLVKPRLSIYKSNKHVYSQLIDDINSHTVCSSSSVEKEILELLPKVNLNMSLAYSVGKQLGNRAKKKNIENVVFDRNYQLYHGKIKTLIQGIRDEGIAC